jgi:23S rRNA-/tRNA-specific pseudouridylate synthase
MITVMVSKNMAGNVPRIVFENDEYWVVDKPAGWLSVPARNPTPADLVVNTWLSESGVREVFTVHRLDRFTSGIMLFAKTKVAHQQANEWFMNRTVKKIYEFLASPPPSRPAIQIKTPVMGKPAQTLFEVVRPFLAPTGLACFLGRATPLTGRFHQIREHARDAGFPILGDPSTGGASFPGIERVCLHAKLLTLPFGTFEVELPAEWQAWLPPKT